MTNSDIALLLLTGIGLGFTAYGLFLGSRIGRLDASIRMHEAMLAEERRPKGLPAAE